MTFAISALVFTAFIMAAVVGAFALMFVRAITWVIPITTAIVCPAITSIIMVMPVIISAPVIPIVASSVIAALAIILISGRVDVLVPIVLHKVNRSAASIVSATII